MSSKIASAVGTGLLAVSGMVLTAAPASAETNPHCSDSRQIGTTGYIKSGGATIGSVKQFIGCGKNWSYTYVWDSFRSSHSSWEVCTSVAVGRSAPYDLRDLMCHTKKKNNWSSGASTVNACTHAIGNIRWGSNQPNAKTDIRC